MTRDIWGSRDLVTVDPASLRPPPQETEIRLLLIDQEHLQTLAAIRARQQREVRTALRQVNSAIQAMQEVPGGSVDQSLARIEDTLRTAAAGPDRARLHALVFALHEVGAAVAQMQAADLLADIRVADEARRFSIKQSAVHAGLYEFALQAAAQRLAAYWKRGLKPADIVELGAWIANTAVLVEVSRKD